jgi:hypothetical protein
MDACHELIATPADSRERITEGVNIREKNARLKIPPSEHVNFSTTKRASAVEEDLDFPWLILKVRSRWCVSSVVHECLRN